MSTAHLAPSGPRTLPRTQAAPHLHRVDAALSNGPRQGPCHESLVNPQSLLVTPDKTLDLQQAADRPMHPEACTPARPLPTKPGGCSCDTVSLAHLMFSRSGRNWPTVQTSAELGSDLGLPLPTSPCCPWGPATDPTFWAITRAEASAQGSSAGGCQPATLPGATGSSPAHRP